MVTGSIVSPIRRSGPPHWCIGVEIADRSAQTGRHAAAAPGSCKCVTVLGLLVGDGGRGAVEHRLHRCEPARRSRRRHPAPSPRAPVAPVPPPSSRPSRPLPGLRKHWVVSFRSVMSAGHEAGWWRSLGRRRWAAGDFDWAGAGETERLDIKAGISRAAKDGERRVGRGQCSRLTLTLARATVRCRCSRARGEKPPDDQRLDARRRSDSRRMRLRTRTEVGVTSTSSSSTTSSTAVSMVSTRGGVSLMASSAA